MNKKEIWRGVGLLIFVLLVFWLVWRGLKLGGDCLGEQFPQQEKITCAAEGCGTDFVPKKGQLYCSEHTCAHRGCMNYAVPEDHFCPEHKCIIEGCRRSRCFWRESDCCWEHCCQGFDEDTHIFCGKQALEGEDFCEDHLDQKAMPGARSIGHSKQGDDFGADLYSDPNSFADEMEDQFDDWDEAYAYWEDTQ